MAMISPGSFAPPMPIARGHSIDDIERVLFYLTCLAAGSLMWLAGRLPMTDLAQHAGQVALWRDLLLGQSAWADLVRINLATPYLIGYGLMLPFSFFFSMETTTRIVLTLAFFAFVGAAVALRREMGGDRRLDWLILLPFFGFAWKWGFLTFLTASPVGLMFLILASRHARAPAWRSIAGLSVTGIVLLFCHGLVFLMALWVGGMMAVYAAWTRRPRAIVTTLLPFAILAIATLGFRLLTAQMEGAMQMHGIIYGPQPLARLAMLAIYVSDLDIEGTPLLPLVTAIALVLPFFMGLRFNRGMGLALVVAFALFAALLPQHAFQTGFLFPRLALFVPLAIAIAFAQGEAALSGWTLKRCPQLGMIACCWVVLGIQATRILAFAAESRPFETVLSAAEPGRRALIVTYDRASPAASHTTAYMHYAAWYQAEKHGFVDFNFASFHPQVVRFRPGVKQEVDEDFGWSPEASLWATTDTTAFDYYFVKATPATVSAMMASAPCRLATIASDGSWTLLGRGDCRSR